MLGRCWVMLLGVLARTHARSGRERDGVKWGRYVCAIGKLHYLVLRCLASEYVSVDSTPIVMRRHWELTVRSHVCVRVCAVRDINSKRKLSCGKSRLNDKPAFLVDPFLAKRNLSHGNTVYKRVYQNEKKKGVGRLDDARWTPLPFLSLQQEKGQGWADFAPRGGIRLQTSVCPPLARAFQQLGGPDPPP